MYICCWSNPHRLTTTGIGAHNPGLYLSVGPRVLRAAGYQCVPFVRTALGFREQLRGKVEINAYCRSVELTEVKFPTMGLPSILPRRQLYFASDATFG